VLNNFCLFLFYIEVIEFIYLLDPIYDPYEFLECLILITCEDLNDGDLERCRFFIFNFSFAYYTNVYIFRYLKI